uniref:Uncharacterized protein n=1 Tax=Schizaphis graminum TaxID=13262 RepID=A0A2S2PJ68_SCHGA
MSRSPRTLPGFIAEPSRQPGLRPDTAVGFGTVIVVGAESLPALLPLATASPQSVVPRDLSFRAPAPLPEDRSRHDDHELVYAEVIRITCAGNLPLDTVCALFRTSLHPVFRHRRPVRCPGHESQAPWTLLWTDTTNA